MRAHEFITGHVIYNPAYTYKFQLKTTIVDLCASWDSHLPEKLQFTSTIGVGIVEEELLANKRLSQYYVQDLNENPNLQFIDDESIDVVLCTLSVDLLIKVCLCSTHWIAKY